VTIAQKQKQLTDTLAALKTPQDRLAYIVGRGRATAPLDDAMKTDAHRLEGCLAKVWFIPEFKEGKCFFKADSDSAIVKGVTVLLCEFYSNQTPQEIAGTKPEFLEKFGITQHLTPNRRNSLAKLWTKIESFARSVVKRLIGIA
jgi:cysteine desulfuration protein SufE